MERREFIKLSTLTGASFLIPGSKYTTDFLCSFLLTEDNLENIFLNPPRDAKPFTWWHWMNGNVSKIGIDLDLNFLYKSGIGGFQLFQVGTGIPKGNVDFGGDEWSDLIRHTAELSSQLNLEFDLMNCGGWSSSGGPWITPEYGMQQLVWTEKQVVGGKKLSFSLPHPYSKLNFYRDTYVLAFPTPGNQGDIIDNLIEEVVDSQGNILAKELFCSGLWQDPAKIDHPDHTGNYYVQIKFKNNFLAKSVLIFISNLQTQGNFGFSGPQNIELLYSTDGTRFMPITSIPFRGGVRDQAINIPIADNFDGISAKYYRISSRFPFNSYYIRLLSSYTIYQWPIKANYTRIGSLLAGQYLPPTLRFDNNSIVHSSQILDISSSLNGDTISWDAPEGIWTIVRFGYTPIGISNHPSPDGGGGLECDKYSRTAYEYHFNHFFGNILKYLEPLGKNGLAGALIDSYEVGMQTWTSSFPEEFRNRRGYDIQKYLPALIGYIVDSPEISDRFLWDIRRTHSDMMVNNYYGAFAEICKQHGLKSYAEPYSGGPFDEIQAGSKLDVPMGEFWAGMDESNGVFYSVKLASSIAHIYGKKIVAAESFTGYPSQSKWQLHPYAMKGQGDWMYTLGLNKFIFHVYAMQPHPTAKPGMTMGPWGWMHSRNNTWADYEINWITYIQRVQSILQTGTLVADLLYFVGEEVPIDTPVLPNQLFPNPPKGYFYDVIDGNGILSRLRTEGNDIVLPDGMRYRLLIIPNTPIISLNILRRIRELVEDGMYVVVGATVPQSNPGLTNYPESDADLKNLVNDIWGNITQSNSEKIIGNGKVFLDTTFKDILNKLDISPDFEYTSASGDAIINFIHRKISDSDVYFIANRRRTREDIVCTFRIKDKSPEIWDPVSGKIFPIRFYENLGDRIRLPLHLSPFDSLFVVFREPVSGSATSILYKDGVEIASTKDFPLVKRDKYASIFNNFTISFWAKPETEINLVANSFLPSYISWVFYPLPGESLYESGHANCGLCLGRNGAIVYERTTHDDFNTQLSANIPVSGWSNVILMYRDGTPALYLNGKLVATGTQSRFIVHPGLNQSVDDHFYNPFHGEIKEVKLFDYCLSEDEINSLYEKGRPEPDVPPIWEYSGDKSTPSFLFYEKGKYNLKFTNGRVVDVNVDELKDPIEILGPWELNFPDGLGAPKQIKLEKLISLKDHSDDGVKYFSGTVTYKNRFDFSYSLPNINLNKIFLDLGWVEIIAEVILNGKNLGVLWKVPYRIDVTHALKTGINDLIIKVTNLWPNRLIGDEHLPSENEYNTGGRGEFSASIKKLPDWYIEGKPKPSGGRITFTTWKHYTKDDPLLESGLLGPVKLIFSKEFHIEE